MDGQDTPLDANVFSERPASHAGSKRCWLWLHVDGHCMQQQLVPQLGFCEDEPCMSVDVPDRQ